MATRPIEKDIDVDAPRKTVWEVLTGEDTYPDWTAPFGEGSTAQTDWQEGGTVRFLGPDGTGLLGQVVTGRRPELLDIEYTGVVGGGQDDTTSEQALLWAGTHETYRLTEADGGGTHLAVSAPMEDAYHDDMAQAWDRALARVRELAEGR